MTLKLLVFGKTGQLAQALARETAGAGHNAIFLDRASCDLSGAPHQIKMALEGEPKPDVVIIAAAYTDVSKAESNRQIAYSVNAHAPKAIAEICAEKQIPLIHISTDYVFDGKSESPYSPDSPTNPINVYGASKLQGERGILGAGGPSVILRTSWVFDGKSDNFLTSMLRLSQLKDKLYIVDDQIGRPTYAGDLAKATLHVAKALIKNPEVDPGIFHVSGTGPAVSWAAFAKAIFASLSGSSDPLQVIGIPSSEYPTPAERPKYSVLDVTGFEEVFSYPLPTWIEGLTQALEERS